MYKDSILLLCPDFHWVCLLSLTSYIFTRQLQISYALYIGTSIVTYREVSLVKLPNTLSGNEVIMFEDKSLILKRQIY